MVAEARSLRRMFWNRSRRLSSPVPGAGALIERIQSLNPTATAERLAGFDAPALRLYLEHLLFQRTPRGTSRSWDRPGDTAAIVTREPVD